ncbi:hypothetical protein AOQ73_28085 [Bradyrhizobium pachyrhizi]|nr:hypothetical protein AOQ73_28085 [Bradyrhizobium pachyrhizi]
MVLRTASGTEAASKAKPFEHQLAPFGSASMSFLPGRFQFMAALFGQGRKQGFRLQQVIVRLCKPASACKMMRLWAA